MFLPGRFFLLATLAAAVISTARGGTLSLNSGSAAASSGAAGVVRTTAGNLVFNGGTLNTAGGTLNVSGGNLTVGGGTLDLGTGGVIIINPGGGIVTNPPQFGGVFYSPAAAIPEILWAPFRPGSAAITGLADLQLGLAPVAAVCDDTRLYMATLNGGAQSSVPYSASALWACDLQSASPKLELLHSFPQDGSFAGRALLLKEGWLYGTTVANNATIGSTVYRFHLASRAFETLAVLPAGSETVPVSLAIAPNGDLFILTSRAAGTVKSLPFTLSFFQTGVMNFPPDAVSGSLLRRPAGGGVELVHTFRPGGLPGLTTAALNLPSEIVCDTDGILYGTTTGRRLFTLVPGEALRWMPGNLEDALGEGPYGSTFTWDGTGVGSVQFKDRRVPLHVAENGIRFHPSSRGNAPTQALAEGQLLPVPAEKWPVELEFATELFSAGPGRVVALLEAGVFRRLAVASAEEGLRPLPSVNGFGGSGIVARASNDTIVATDLMASTLVAPAVDGLVWPPQRLKKLVLASNTAPSPVADVFQGAWALYMGNGQAQPYVQPPYFLVASNDLDAEGDRLRVTSVSTAPIGGVSLLPNAVALTALPVSPVFDFSVTYAVRDGFGGEGNGTVTFRNRAPVPAVVSRNYDPAGILIDATELGADPDGDWVFIEGVSHAVVEPPAGGRQARITVPDYGEYGVVITDKLGARATATLRVLPAAPVDVVQQINLVGGTGEVAFPTVGPEGEELSASIIEAPVDGTVTFVDGVAHYMARRRFDGFDTFKYAVQSVYGVRGTVTVQVRDVGRFMAGTYHAFGSEDRSLARLTLGKNGRYTLGYRIGGRTFRFRGNLSVDREWIIPRAGGNLAIRVRLITSPEPALQMLTGPEGTELAPLTIYHSSELSALRAPRIHAELTNTAITPAPVIFKGGAFYSTAAPGRQPLPPSYAIIMRTPGGGAAIAGRLYDGRPWSGAGFVTPENQLAVVSGQYTGILFARANGNVAGTLKQSGAGPQTVLSTVAGSPFRAPQSGRNVFGGTQTNVAGRSAFPGDLQFAGFVGIDGRLLATLPHGITNNLQVKSADGILAGSISVPWTGESRSVQGLFIPHRKRVVGFVGEQSGKSITFQQQ